MMPHAIQHYQTCFRIASPDENALRRVQKILFDWISGKEVDRNFQASYADFKHVCKWGGLDETKSVVHTTTCYNENGQAWALHYEERDRRHGALRFWYTDVGLHKISGELVVFARISYAWNQTDLSNFQIAPESSVPRFIRSILNSGLTVYSNRPEFRLIDRPVVLKVGYGKGLAEWIVSRERKYPILVFNGSTLPLVRESEVLAKALAGKCQVLRLPEDKDLAEEVRCYLSKDISIPYNQFRVYFPLNPVSPHLARHRWYDVEDESYPEQRTGIVNGLLRNYSAFDKDAVESIGDVYRLISQAKLLKFQRDNPEKADELAEFYQLLAETEKERDAHKQIADFASSECDAREAEIADLKRQMHLLVDKSRQVGVLKSHADFIRTFKELPGSLVDVVEVYSRLYPDRLVFTEDARASAEKYSAFSEIGVAWSLFHEVAHLLFEIKFSPKGEHTGDLEKDFDSRCQFELTMSETKATKRDSALMSLRVMVYDGVEYDITPHVKWGSREPKLLRVHFAFDETSKRIIIGHVGVHLPTAGTRKLS